MWLKLWSARTDPDRGITRIREMHSKHPELFERTDVALYNSGGELILEFESDHAEARALALRVENDLRTS